MALVGSLLLALGLSNVEADTVHEIDTEHLFGFTEGSDIGGPDERELESETTARLGKRGGRYQAADSALVLKLPLSDRFRIAPGLSFALYDVGVPSLGERNPMTLGGAFVEGRMRLLTRDEAPFGLTLNTVIGSNRIDPATGLGASGLSGEMGLLIDREIVPGQVVAGLNLVYALGQSRVDGIDALQRASGLEVSAAFAARFAPGLFLGVETRYARAYAGTSLDRFSGDALYVGPTLYRELTESIWISFAWGVQIAGRESGEGHERDLANFDRHQARLRIGTHF
ncbi:hypothetical protein [Methylobacterium brachythecii]|uniref:Uncharacterized protein n=1 Tax=Methylobacterium brachythecii TaxID=1176177 RepID=A0A7W6F5K7_9HYPH|nr:hypothetical protein [Methylobacterium brachythecii]MBB3901462.1 hypothetical protein [Methylobacterium brachythecii]GLS43034.1 hypothetical protein GCM10007884_10190 [Methylobacterium brachythecii]